MKNVKTILMGIAAALVSFSPQTAHCFEAPSSGSFAYSVYDLFMNDILTGAIGFVITAGLILYAIFWAVRSNLFGCIICAICAGLIIFIEDVVVSLGMLV